MYKIEEIFDKKVVTSSSKATLLHPSLCIDFILNFKCHYKFFPLVEFGGFLICQPQKNVIPNLTLPTFSRSKHSTARLILKKQMTKIIK